MSLGIVLTFLMTDKAPVLLVSSCLLSFILFLCTEDTYEVVEAVDSQ